MTQHFYNTLEYLSRIYFTKNEHLHPYLPTVNFLSLSLLIHVFPENISLKRDITCIKKFRESFGYT